MTISLTGPVTLTVTPAQTRTFTEIKVQELKDQPSDKIVTAHIENYMKSITLWEGAAYDAIGQWTDTQAMERIKEVLLSHN